MRLNLSLPGCQAARFFSSAFLLNMRVSDRRKSFEEPSGSTTMSTCLLTILGTMTLCVRQCSMAVVELQAGVPATSVAASCALWHGSSPGSKTHVKKEPACPYASVWFSDTDSVLLYLAVETTTFISMLGQVRIAKTRHICILNTHVLPQNTLSPFCQYVVAFQGTRALHTVGRWREIVYCSVWRSTAARTCSKSQHFLYAFWISKQLVLQELRCTNPRINKVPMPVSVTGGEQVSP
jgi:hypothetical protein